MSGFQVITQPFGFQVQAPNPQRPMVALPLVNATPGHDVIYPGAVVGILGRNLALGPTGTAVTLNDLPAQVLTAMADQVYIMVPMDMPVGPAVLRLHNGAESAYPVVVQIDTAPPQLNAVLSSLGEPADARSPVRVGDVLNVLFSGVDLEVAQVPSRIRVCVGEIEMQTLVVVPLGSQPGVLLAQVLLGPTAPGSQVPVTVSVDGGPRSSAFYIAVF